MELSKKLLLALAATALVFSFASCKEEDDEDDSIQGADIECVNEATNTIKRAYSSTKLKHFGSLTSLELKDQAIDSNNGVIGLIWDLKKHNEATSTGDDLEDTLDTDGTVKSGTARDFWIVGFRNSKGKLQYYISKYYNVSNFQDDNFGQKGTNGEAWGNNTDATARVSNKILEQEIVPLPAEEASSGAGYLGEITLDADSDDKTVNTSVYVWVDVYPAAYNSYGVNRATLTEDQAKEGQYVVDVYVQKDKPTVTDTPKRTVLTQTQTGYTSVGRGSDADGKKLKQAKIARYVNSYQAGLASDGTTVVPNVMKGKIKYQDTYAEDEVIEE